LERQRLQLFILGGQGIGRTGHTFGNAIFGAKVGTGMSRGTPPVSAIQVASKYKHCHFRDPAFLHRHRIDPTTGIPPAVRVLWFLALRSRRSRRSRVLSWTSSWSSSFVAPPPRVRMAVASDCCRR